MTGALGLAYHLGDCLTCIYAYISADKSTKTLVVAAAVVVVSSGGLSLSLFAIGRFFLVPPFWFREKTRESKRYRQPSRCPSDVAFLLQPRNKKESRDKIKCPDQSMHTRRKLWGGKKTQEGGICFFCKMSRTTENFYSSIERFQTFSPLKSADICVCVCV